jgi:hypothetical protein
MLLVTTEIDGNFNEFENVLFLGEWCKSSHYQNKQATMAI